MSAASDVRVARATPAVPAAGPATTPAPPRARVRWFALRRDIPGPAYTALAAGSFLAFLLFWEAITRLGLLDAVFVPAPSKVWDAALGFVREGGVWDDVSVSVLRVTGGFLLSALLAIPIGLLVGSYRVAEGLVQPITEFVRYIPVPALIPLMMLLFGIGEMPKVMLIFAGTYFQLVLMVADEVRRVPYDLVQVSYTLGATRREIIRHVLWPGALPGIFDALRLCNGWAWTYLVVAELVAANEGLGYRILKFSRFLQTPKIFVYLLLLGVIGLTLDLCFRALNRRLFFWAAAGRS